MDRINALRLFTRLAALGSFSAAAKDLKVKQSTASKWVAELESELGAKLVQRTTRAVHITEAGQRLLARATGIVGAFDELSAEFEAQSPEPSGSLRISAPVVFGKLFVVPALALVVKRHSKLRAEIVFSDRYVNLVEEGFDLAVRVGIPVDTSARGRKLAESKRVLVASPAYLRAHGAPKAPRELSQHECLIHGDAARGAVWRFSPSGGPARPTPVKGRLTANNSEAVLELAKCGLGIALLADWLVEDELKRKRLLPLLEAYSAPPAPIYALTPPGRFSSPGAQALAEEIRTGLARGLGNASRKRN